MARPTKPNKDGTPPEKAAPSLSLSETQAKIDADKEATLERVLATAPTPAGVKAETPGTPPEEPPAAPETPAEEVTPEKYMEWWQKQPETYRRMFGENVINANARALDEYYGPEISAVLAKVKNNPRYAKAFAALSDEKQLEWITDTALAIYNDPKYAPEPSLDAPDPKTIELEAKVQGLEDKLTAGERKQREAEEMAYRRNDTEALIAMAPTLKFDWNGVAWTDDGKWPIPKTGKTRNDPDFARAMRFSAVVNRANELTAKQGRLVPYAEAYEELKGMWDEQAANPPPRPIPSTSTKEIPSPQAPRTKVEVRRGMTEQVAKHGNISNLARALRS